MEGESFLLEGLACVEEILHQAMASRVSSLGGAAQHILRSGGKRIRPTVMLCAFYAAGGEDTARVAPLAAAVELLHTASLIHDDINDASDVRRGKPTINAKWGNTLALLAGDFVFVKLLHFVAGVEPEVVRVLGGACEALVEGETMQVLTAWDETFTEQGYLHMIGLKTATVFSACGRIGALLAKGSPGQVKALGEYGYQVGMAFQICDDTLDLVGDAQVLGKPVRRDLTQGKLNLASLYAAATAEEGAQALRARDAAGLQRAIAHTGGVGYALERARAYAQSAKEHLTMVPPSPAQYRLWQLADMVVQCDEEMFPASPASERVKGTADVVSPAGLQQGGSVG